MRLLDLICVFVGFDCGVLLPVWRDFWLPVLCALCVVLRVRGKEAEN